MASGQFPPSVHLADSEWRVLYLLSLTQQVHELVSALSQCATPAMAGHVSAAAAEARRGLCSITPVFLRDVLVCELVLDAVAKTQGQKQPAAASASPGIAVVQALQECIYGPELRSLPFVKLVHSQSYEQALQAQRACAGLLMAALSPANCFSLLALGHRQRLRSLEAHAQGTALEEFAAAMALDRAGFCALPEQVLGDLLASDELQVDSELVVYEALALWVQADKPARLPAFHALFVRCVRLGCMGRVDLYRLDQHPLLTSCTSVMKLVAFAYLSMCYGVTVPGECHSYIAASSTERKASRRRAAGAAAPPLEDGRLTPLIRTAPRLLEEPGQAPDAPIAAAAAAVGAAQQAAGAAAGTEHAQDPMEGVHGAGSSSIAEETASSSSMLVDSAGAGPSSSVAEQWQGLERLPSPPRRPQSAQDQGMVGAGMQTPPLDTASTQQEQRCRRQLRFCPA